MIKRANEEGITVKELGERFIAEYFKDAQAIGIHKATIHPKATENIDAIINVVKKLVDNGYAYDVDGNVYSLQRNLTNTASFQNSHWKIWRQVQN